MSASFIKRYNISHICARHFVLLRKHILCAIKFYVLFTYVETAALRVNQFQFRGVLQNTFLYSCARKPCAFFTIFRAKILSFILLFSLLRYDSPSVCLQYDLWYIQFAVVARRA